MIRTFVAVDVSAQVAARAAKLIDRLRVAGAKATWTQASNLHLTLKFLGEIPDVRVPEVCRAVDAACRGCSRMKLSFRGAGAFPRNEQPRTVWLGVQPETDDFVKLHQAAEAQLYELGFAKERRRFVPHLTIGRVRAGGPAQLELGQLITQNVEFDAGSCTVAQVLVYGSFLDKSGPTYQVLGRASLG